jgi:hypothetical protein
MCMGELLQEAPPEQARQHTYWREEAGPAGDPPLTVWRKASAGHDVVYVRMVRERRAPRVQHECRADLCAQMLRVSGDGSEGFGGNIEQQAGRADHRFHGGAKALNYRRATHGVVSGIGEGAWWRLECNCRLIVKPVRWRHRRWLSDDLAGEPVMLVLSKACQTFSVPRS